MLYYLFSSQSQTSWSSLKERSFCGSKGAGASVRLSCRFRRLGDLVELGFIGRKGLELSKFIGFRRSHSDNPGEAYKSFKAG